MKNPYLITDQQHIDAIEAIIDVLAEPLTAADPVAGAERILKELIEILGMRNGHIDTDHEAILAAFKAGHGLSAIDGSPKAGYVVGLLMTATNGKANPATLGKLVEEWLEGGDG